MVEKRVTVHVRGLTTGGLESFWLIWGLLPTFKVEVLAKYVHGLCPGQWSSGVQDGGLATGDQNSGLVSD